MGYDEMGHLYAIKKFFTKEERKERGSSDFYVNRAFLPSGASRDALIGWKNGSKLNHPNIIKIYDLLFLGGRNWAILEYVEGPSFGEIARKTFTRKTAIKLGEQYINALEHLTEHNLYHHDLFGHNLMVSGELQLKLIDLDSLKSLSGKDGVIRFSAYGYMVHLGDVLKEMLARGNFEERELKLMGRKMRAITSRIKRERQLPETPLSLSDKKSISLFLKRMHQLLSEL